MHASESESERRIGVRVRLQRQARGLTQTDLARLIGRTQSSISEFESGAIVPSGRTLQRLSVALDMPVDWILNGSPGVTGETQDLLVRLIEAFGETGAAELSNATDAELRRLVRLFRASRDEKDPDD